MSTTTRTTRSDAAASHRPRPPSVTPLPTTTTTPRARMAEGSEGAGRPQRAACRHGAAEQAVLPSRRRGRAVGGGRG